MSHSLWVRLLFGFTISIMLAVGTLAVFVNQMAGSELKTIRQNDEQAAMMRTRGLADALAAYYGQHGNWQGVQDFLTQVIVFDQQVVLTDNDGRVVGDSRGTPSGDIFKVPDGAFSYTLNQRGMMPQPPQVVGTLYVLQTLPGFTSSRLALFLGLGSLLAIAIAGVFTWLISSRIVAPVRSLIGAAGRISKGDFSQRVSVADKTEIGDLARSFNAMAAELETSEKLKKNLIADVAHELRTPVSSIRGYLEAIQDDVIQPDSATIGLLDRQAQLLARLVNDLQELNLAESGQLSLVREPASVDDIIRTAAAAINSKLTATGLNLEVEVSDGLPPVSVDRLRLEQILNNLLTNAVAHTPPGGTVAISASASPESLEIRVSDTGEGIPAEDLPFIFERFYRVDKSRTRATGGTGLGLTIVKRLAEAHGGRVRVESQVGRGTTFFLTLPVSAVGPESET